MNLYTCDGCGQPIAATANDPVHRPGTQTLCASCMPRHAAPAAPEPKKLDGRKAAGAARWASMTTEERAARVAKMQAGRLAGRTP